MSSDSFCRGLREGFLFQEEIVKAMQKIKEIMNFVEKKHASKSIITKEEWNCLHAILEKYCWVQTECERIFCTNGWDLDKNGTDCRPAVEKILTTGRELIQECDLRFAHFKLSCLSLPD
jgi:hypothetical protein